VSTAFAAGLLRRQLTLALRRPAEMANPLLFFAMVVMLFPLGIGPDPSQLARFAPGIFWIVALLSTLMAAESMFRSDFEDGSLEQLVLMPQPLFFSCLVYAAAHWLITGLPLVIMAPLFAVMLQLPGSAIGVLMLSLLLGTGVLSLVGSIGAALTVGLRRGGILLSLLILPLYVPVLIFGSGAVQFAAQGNPALPQLSILAGMLALAVALAPLACAAGLRISVDAG